MFSATELERIRQTALQQQIAHQQAKAMQLALPKAA